MSLSRRSFLRVPLILAVTRAASPLIRLPLPYQAARRQGFADDVAELQHLMDTKTYVSLDSGRTYHYKAGQTVNVPDTVSIIDGNGAILKVEDYHDAMLDVKGFNANLSIRHLTFDTSDAKAIPPRTTILYADTCNKCKS